MKMKDDEPPSTEKRPLAPMFMGVTHDRGEENKIKILVGATA